MAQFRGKAGNPINGAVKQFSASKAVTSAVTVTADLLAMVNAYALEPLVAEDIFIGKQLLAHNGVDRDGERFPETILDNFVETLPGKSALYAHDRGSFLPLGLYFDTKTETMSVAEFKALTGNDPRLPDGVDQVKALWAWYYVVITDDVKSVLQNIKGGTYRHWSIGFNAASIVSIKDDPNGPVKYWEYVGPAEALEGSLVWLGAQQGATSQKSASKHLDENNNSDTEENESMKTLALKLGIVLKKSFGDNTTEDQLVEAVKTALATQVTTIDTLTAEAKTLKANAELGQKYLDGQVEEYVRLKALLKECDETEEGKKQLSGFAKGMGVEFLEQEVKNLTQRVGDTFPEGGQLDGAKGHNGGGEKNPLVVG